MPRQDGTGPDGQGPLTGRGFGPCENKRPRFFSFKRQRSGRGFGRMSPRRGFFGRFRSTRTDNIGEREALETELSEPKKKRD